jgi:hypothetical protein
VTGAIARIEPEFYDAELEGFDEAALAVVHAHRRLLAQRAAVPTWAGVPPFHFTERELASAVEQARTFHLGGTPGTDGNKLAEVSTLLDADFVTTPQHLNCI